MTAGSSPSVLAIGTLARSGDILARVCVAVLSLFLAAGVAIALWPEDDARLLAPADGFTATGNFVLLKPSVVGKSYVQVRSSVAHDASAAVGSNHVAATGYATFGPYEITSAPFQATGVVSILRSGNSGTPSADIELELRCSTNFVTLPISTGSVHANILEALIPIPDDWCPHEARLHAVSTSPHLHVGAGSVYQLDAISWWKRGFLGLLPYFAIAFGVVAAYCAAGAILFGRWLHPVAASGTGIGLAATLAFVFYGFAPSIAVAANALMLAGAAIACGLGARSAVARATLGRLRPYLLTWLAVSFGAFALLFAAYNGSGHWEPNARFLPATWSSDLELPWMFAEALRQGADVETLFGVGGWRPTDRGPLMTGGHLLSSELFSAMQSVGNDGRWLRGYAYNASAIVLNALWAPAVLFALREVFRLGAWASALGCFLIALTPFALFNTIYGWPKLFGGAFAIVAVGHAAFSRTETAPSGDRRLAIGFGAASAFSILSHAANAFFLAPVAIWYFLTRLMVRPRALILGVAVGVALLAPWQAYKTLVVPSDDPLTKYALSGDFGFGRPEMSTLDLVKETYAKLDFVDWMVLKGKLLASPFVPVVSATNDTRPVAWRAFHGVDNLRQWDFYLLSAGNIIVIAGFLLYWLSKTRPILEGDNRPDEGLFSVGILASFLFQVVVFVPTLFILQLPYGLILALAVVSAAALSHTRRLLVWALTAQGAYSLIVWGLAPLRAALYLDGFALVALVLMAIGLARFAVGGTHGALDGAAGNGVRHG